MKPLKFCANGDGRPVCPPSKVICKECLDEISRTLEKMIEDFAQIENGNIDQNAQGWTRIFPIKTG